MARPRADRLRVAGVLTLAVTAPALGLASSAMPAGNGTPSPAQARPAIDAAGVIETVEHHVDPVISSEYPVSDPAATLPERTRDRLRWHELLRGLVRRNLADPAWWASQSVRCSPGRGGDR